MDKKSNKGNAYEKYKKPNLIDDRELNVRKNAETQGCIVLLLVVAVGYTTFVESLVAFHTVFAIKNNFSDR